MEEEVILEVDQDLDQDQEKDTEDEKLNRINVLLNIGINLVFGYFGWFLHLFILVSNLLQH